MEFEQENFLEKLQKNITKRIPELEKVKQKDIILIIGSTGSGKSTFINYLFNCKMEELPINHQAKKLIRVSKNSKIAIKSKIGLGNNSTTCYPKIFENEKKKIILVDFPGFYDNRGSEFNITNALILKNLFNFAKSVKIFLLIEFGSFSVLRGQGADKAILTLEKLFKNEKQMELYKNSFFILVTKTPKNTPIKDFIEKLESNFRFRKFLERILFYHPLDLEREYFDKKNDIFRKMENLNEIVNPKNIFQIFLDDKDLKKMDRVGEFLKGKLEEVLIYRNYEKVSVYFQKIKLFIKLGNLGNKCFLFIYKNLENRILKNFDDRKNKIKLDICFKAFKDSKKNLEILKNDLNFINDKKFKNRINLEELENFFNQQKKQYEDDLNIKKFLKNQNEITKNELEEKKKRIKLIKEQNKKIQLNSEKKINALNKQIDNVKKYLKKFEKGNEKLTLENKSNLKILNELKEKIKNDERLRKRTYLRKFIDYFTTEKNDQ